MQRCSQCEMLVNELIGDDLELCEDCYNEYTSFQEMESDRT